MKHLFITILALLCAIQGFAQKAEADSAYSAGRYEEAVALYDSLAAAEGPSAEVYYNLGCCHYRLDNVALAVLNFERALLLEPGDDDIRTNLEMARAKTIDKIIPHHEIFFVLWGRQIVNLMSVDKWATTAVTAFLLMLLCLCAYLFASRMWIKKTGFYAAVAALAVCLLSNVCAWQGRQRQANRLGAIVMGSSAVVHSTPASNGVDLFVIHEGTRVDIIDDTMREWKEIQLADGKKGWIETKAIERI